jgi:hypothetical protein
VKPIARVAARLNVRDRAGARTLEGLFRPSPGLPGVSGGAKRESSETPRRRPGRLRGRNGEARGRSLGEIPGQVPAGTP